MSKRLMRAVRVNGHGELDALQLENLPVPEPGAGEVRLSGQAVTGFSPERLA